MAAPLADSGRWRVQLGAFSDTASAAVRITGGQGYTSGQAWGFGPASAQITSRPAVTGMTAGGFTYPVPPLTALHLVLRK